MTPEEAVTQLGDIVAAKHEVSEDEICQALADAGMPDEIADRSFKFTQIAWGRVFLDNLGIDFSDDYMWFDANGNVVASGRLTEEPFYAAAMQLAGQYTLTPAFARLALTSADVHSVNDALNAGSNPKDLVTGPTCLFIEAPTDDGMEKARQTLTEYLKK
jgi:hypothetical protein